MLLEELDLATVKITQSMTLRYIVFCTMMLVYFLGSATQLTALFLFPLLLLNFRQFSNFRFDWSAWLILIGCAFALVAHIGDMRSVLNVGLTALMVFIMASTARARTVRDLDFFPQLSQACEFMFWLSLAVSTAATAAHLPFGQSTYAWETFAGDSRLLLLTQESYGHTASLWLAAFGLVGRVTRDKPLTLLNVTMGSALAASLLMTKTRIGLILLGFILMVGLLRLIHTSPRKIATLVTVLAWSYSMAYFVITFNDHVRHALEDAILSAQAEFPGLRLVSGSATSMLLSGRDDLNARLVSLIESDPLGGVGQSNDVLNIAYSSTPNARVIGGSESPLRLPAKYGIPFAVMFFLLLLRTTWAVHRSVPGALIFACILATASSEATFEVMHGVGGFYFFICMACIEIWKRDRKNAPQLTPPQKLCLIN